VVGKSVKSDRRPVAEDLGGVAGNDHPVFDWLGDDAARAHHATRADVRHDDGTVANPRVFPIRMVFLEVG